MQILKDHRFLAALSLAGVLVFILSRPMTSTAQTSPGDQFTPGMLFGPLLLTDGQHIELCAGNLGEGDLSAFIHFRNLSTGEVTAAQEVKVTQGGGDCAYYTGTGRIVGMARGDGRASDWVSPTNALISTMSVIDDANGGKATVSVLGNAKLWLRGL